MASDTQNNNIGKSIRKFVFLALYAALGAILGSVVLRASEAPELVKGFASFGLCYGVAASFGVYQLVSFALHAGKAMRERTLDVAVRKNKGFIVAIPVVTAFASLAGMLTGTFKTFTLLGFVYGLGLWLLIRKGYVSGPSDEDA